jgi:Ca-activated chloride channel family protein
MKRFVLLFAVMISLLGALAPASAQVIVPPPGGVFTDPEWLKVDYHRVNVRIENQIANTQVDMQFTNVGSGLAEGTFIFPLPKGATVDQLTMWVDGQAIDAKILRADEARGIYDRIVRQYRDPALLEYIGSDVIQANVFPIPPGDSRRIEIAYAQVLEADNGLINFTYPMNTTGKRPIEQISIAVSVTSQDGISSIYSPTHNVAINRAQDTDKAFRAGFEAYNYVPESDFSLFYGLSRDSINLNLLTYRESAREDGFFMLLVQPPLRADSQSIIPKDVIVVLDQSGSMDGEKWEQARKAAAYVLDNLNPEDRFNAILFSTGWRLYSNEMETPAQARGAIEWINSEQAVGGTDINGALLTALEMVGERPTTILFLTDGLATEGEVDTSRILDNLRNAAPANARVFTFGVGDDVDTFLLDSIVRDLRGTGTYVRPGERIDEKVASLYNKINAPVLTDIKLEFDANLMIEWLYPATLPDLFAGEQLTLVGRYRGSAENVRITLSGSVDGSTRSFIYNGNTFPARAGGEPFIARLWATRRIGDLLNTIRLRGENKELVDSVVNLSVRYGIITPYTSFLIEEDDILSQEGRARAVTQFAAEAEALAESFTGASAVDAASTTLNLQQADQAQAPGVSLRGGAGAAPAPAQQSISPLPTQTASMTKNEPLARDEAVSPIQAVNGKTFILQGGVWTDTIYEPDTMETVKVEFLSDDYFDLLAEHPEFGAYLALGERVIFVVDGVAYEITVEA